MSHTHTTKKKYSGCCFFVLPELTLNGHVSKKHRGMAKTRTAARFQPSDPQARDLSFLVSATSQISPQTMEKKQFKPCQGAERILQEPRHTQDLRETGCPIWDLLGPRRRICYLQIPHTAKSEKRVAGRHAKIRHSPEPTKSWNLAGKSPSWTPCVVWHKQCKYILKNCIYIVYIMYYVCININIYIYVCILLYIYIFIYIL